MSLDTARLENARERGGRIIARCPACAEHGHDEKGEHLVIMSDGRFGCVIYPGAAGKEHRQRIYALAADPNTRHRGAFNLRVRRPAEVTLPKPAGKPLDLGHLGTLGTGISNPRATRESLLKSEGEEEIHVHTRSVGRNPSQASQPVPVGDQGPELGETNWCQPASKFQRPQQGLQSWADGPEREAHEARILARFKRNQEYLMSLPTGGPVPDESPIRIDPETGRTYYTADANIDAETGYPIIDGVICPF